MIFIQTACLPARPHAEIEFSHDFGVQSILYVKQKITPKTNQLTAGISHGLNSEKLPSTRDMHLEIEFSHNLGTIHTVYILIIHMHVQNIRQPREYPMDSVPRKRQVRGALGN